MASKGAYARGTDGSDHAYRQRVVDRYTSLVVARRRVRGVLFVSGTIAALFAACTVLSAYAHRDGSVRRALDPRTNDQNNKVAEMNRSMVQRALITGSGKLKVNN